MRIFTEEHKRKLSLSHMGQSGHWTGKKFTQEHKEKLSKSHANKRNSPKTEFKKGLTPWNKGLKGYLKGEKNHKWKGDEVGYYALHTWVKRNYGAPRKCSNCGSIKNIQWANVSHQYTREKNDWIQLCVPCHRVYDKGFEKAKEKYIEHAES